MSTRCQVQVIQSGLTWEGKVTLYHHSDGYPSNIVALIRAAYTKWGRDWKGGRAGKVAGMLCATDPGGFEPEAGHERHGDIAYWYELTVENHGKGSVAEKPSWSLTIEKVCDGKTTMSRKVVALTAADADAVLAAESSGRVPDSFKGKLPAGFTD